MRVQIPYLVGFTGRPPLRFTVHCRCCCRYCYCMPYLLATGCPFFSTSSLPIFRFPHWLLGGGLPICSEFPTVEVASSPWIPFFTRLFSRPTGTRNQHEQQDKSVKPRQGRWRGRWRERWRGRFGSQCLACKLTMSSFCFSLCRAAQAQEMESIQNTATSILQITPMSCHVMQTDSRCLGKSHLLSPLGALPQAPQSLGLNGRNARQLQVEAKTKGVDERLQPPDY
ncbi:hypothetical protein BKA56DRAFT_308126 [Ilyonectria sp. MPI-CAGE-AT-0026]|nr:hypothetical protein BKA56DRAFT_308126 [Ilyonectria sp. MPI-CAGE-AT-0026]